MVRKIINYFIQNRLKIIIFKDAQNTNFYCVMCVTFDDLKETGSYISCGTCLVLCSKSCTSDLSILILLSFLTNCATSLVHHIPCNTEFINPNLSCIVGKQTWHIPYSKAKSQPNSKSPIFIRFCLEQLSFWVRQTLNFETADNLLFCSATRTGHYLISHALLYGKVLFFMAVACREIHSPLLKMKQTFKN